ncbi:MAG: SCO family protein [Gemmatimonadaceae bacterium]|nr:SCO family protein [Gemmatimonadaceae bacterium]
MRTTPTYSLVWRVRAAAGLAALVFATACSGEPTFRGIMVDPPRAVAGFRFTLPTGEQYDTGANGKQPTLFFFGYTHCPDVCPTTLVDWKRAKEKLGRDSDRVRFVFVTVDPTRDTPSIADRYAKRFDSTFVGVSGDSATTAQIMSTFGVSAAREAIVDSANYFVAHSAQAFLVDATGRLVAMYSFGMGWEPLVHDLGELL